MEKYWIVFIAIIIIILLSLICLVIYTYFNSQINENFKIYTFWTGDNEMSKQRKNCLKQLRKKSKCNVILITPKNLNNYILKNHPLHKSYQYLSQTHKADYLRTYFMRFYGGGYSDIKKTSGSWTSSFEKLKNNKNIWIVGYKEVKDGVANSQLVDKWEDLIGNCAYICKKDTPLVIEWYNQMIKLLENRYEELKNNPSTFPQDQKDSGSGYPLGWNEMLGNIFHPIVYKYKDNVSNTLPISIFNNYR